MILDLKLIEYQEAYKIQKEFVRRRKLGEIGDSVILAEHKPVFTIGRTGRRENLLVGEEALRDEGIGLFYVDRGGDITFHGPGQLVVYPIINLRYRTKDLHRYLRDLEEVTINFLKSYSVRGNRIRGRPGVWVDNRKIVFIGTGASGWVTYHGLSINIDVDLKYFSMINPCGYSGIELTSLDKILNRYIAMDEVKERFLSHFSNIFYLGEMDFADKCLAAPS